MASIAFDFNLPFKYKDENLNECFGVDMANFKVIFFILIFITGLEAYADQPLKNDNIFCNSLLQPNPNYTADNYVKEFDKSFVAKIPFEQIQSIFSDLYRDAGRCVQFTTKAQASPGRFILTLLTDKQFEISFLLVVDKDSGLITGLLLKEVTNPSIIINSWSDVQSTLKNLDQSGTTGATLKTSDGKLLLSSEGDHVFAIGSTFKLYVLGALESSIARGEHSWNEKLAIHEEWKSLPSGTMQNLPDGQLVSLLDFATNMVSISDNTAADHLLNFLGRPAVEKMGPLMGNQHWSQNMPFMSTAEMFKLKWAVDPKQMSAYINSDVGTKRSILEGLANVERNTVGTNGVSLELPTNIDKIEWFGTTDDNCNAMLWLADQKAPELRQVLSKNVPFLSNVGQSDSHWNYVGYKGGSEPGVLSMTFLLESKIGTHACLSMSWNNTTRPVSEYLFSDVVLKTLKFVESQVP